MNKSRLVLSLTMFLLMTAVAWSLSNISGKWESPGEIMIIDATHNVGVNSLDMIITNVGNYAYDKTASRGRNDGLYFPRGTNLHCIYDAGIWLGAKVNGRTRIAVAEYSSEFTPGPMLDGTFQTDSPDFRVYELNRGDDAATNPDFAIWPVNQGAPVDSTGSPAILGDQMAWAVYNDGDPAQHSNNAGSTQPLGLEIQQSTFAFARAGALGNAIYLKFRIINKGPNQLDSAFVSAWSDPDLGEASDDLVGCDTLLSLGYCYNSGPDNLYGAAPPSVGFVFLEGPIIPAAPEDSALVSGKWRHGFKNLPMTAFNRYVNGTDPDNPSVTYTYMKGLNRDGTQVINPVTNEVTTFVASGDPKEGTGWLDPTPADKRMMLNAGPFTMNPGDTQEVVIACIVGQGTDPISSVSALKNNVGKIQAVFNLNFQIPNPPPPPSVWARGIEGGVDLSWGDEPVGTVDSSAILNQEFHFEGFNVWQGASAVGPWTKFATYDISDQAACGISDISGDPPETTFTFCDVASLYGDVVDPAAGGTQRLILQKGSNSGLQYHLSLNTSKVDGSPLKDNQPYWYAVTAYSYDVRNMTPFFDLNQKFLGFIVENLESPIISYEVRPRVFSGVFQDTAQHTGTSDGTLAIEYMIPADVTGHTYQVGFAEDLTWFLRDLNLPAAQETLLVNQTNQDPNGPYKTVDGIQWKMEGLPPGIKGWAWAGQTRWITGEAAFGGNPDWLNGGLWNGPDFFGSNIQPAQYRTVEIRFSNTTKQKCYDYLRGGTPNYAAIGYFDCPFTIWDVQSNPPRQLNAGFVENNGQPATYDSTWFPGADGTKAREYLFIFNSTYSETPDPFYMNNNPNANGSDMDIMYAMTPKLRNPPFAITDIQEGDKLTIEAAKPNLPADVFQYTSKKAETVNGTYVANSLDGVLTVPNPYYNYYNEERDQFHRMIKFINLPAAPMTIRVFNIAGDLVRTMQRTDIYNSEFVWDLKTDKGLWVAPGIYVWLIEAPGLGSKYGKMAIFTEVEQLNTF